MRNDFSAVQVHDNIEVQVYACYAGFEIGDVPDPNLVGCSCCMHWLRLTFRSPRSASVVELTIGLEDTIAGRFRCNVYAFISQGGDDLPRWLVLVFRQIAQR